MSLLQGRLRETSDQRRAGVGRRRPASEPTSPVRRDAKTVAAMDRARPSGKSKQQLCSIWLSVTSCVEINNRGLPAGGGWRSDILGGGPQPSRSQSMPLSLSSFSSRLLYVDRSGTPSRGPHLPNWIQYYPGRHETSNQCWVDAGQASQTLGQH